MPDTAPTTGGSTDEAAAREMPRLPPCPSLFQVNTRVRLRELEATLGRPATLDDIPGAELDRIAAQGFDWVYLLGVWSTGEAGRQVSRSNPEWRREFEALLPDLEERDICGPSFAVTAYAVHPAMGGDAALERLRRRLRARGLRLMLGFVPNHMAPDHRPAEFIPAGGRERVSVQADSTPGRADCRSVPVGAFAPQCCLCAYRHSGLSATGPLAGASRNRARWASMAPLSRSSAA